MSDRLTALPGTAEYLRQLLEIAKESDHPMDKVAIKELPRMIETEEARAADKVRKMAEWPTWLVRLATEGDQSPSLMEVAIDVWDTWNNEHMSLANNMCLLRDALQRAGADINTYEGIPNPRLKRERDEKEREALRCGIFRQRKVFVWNSEARRFDIYLEGQRDEAVEAVMKALAREGNGP